MPLVFNKLYIVNNLIFCMSYDNSKYVWMHLEPLMLSMLGKKKT